MLTGYAVQVTPLHFDSYDNFLCQVAGTLHFLAFDTLCSGQRQQCQMAERLHASWVHSMIAS